MDHTLSSEDIKESFPQESSNITRNLELKIEIKQMK